MRLCELGTALGLPVEGDPDVEIRGLASLEDAGEGDLSFATGPRYRAAFEASKASAYLLPPDFDAAGRACLRAPAPYAEFARAVDQFYRHRSVEPGVHASAVIDPSAELGDDVYVGPYAVVGAGARIGARTRLHPHVTVYPDVITGADCEIHSGAHLREGVRLGDRVIVQSGAVIGGEGFGFTYSAEGRRVRIPHRMGVEIGDDSQIGANTTIDASHPGHARRGAPETRTRIGSDVVIDNLVQIGHGCVVEDHATLCSFVGLAGSAWVGKGSVMGGRSALGNNVKIGDLVQVAGGSGVTSDVPTGSQVGGYPHTDLKLFRRINIALKRLPELLRRVRALEQGSDRGD